MLAIGLWVTDRIKSSVTYRSAADATLYMENFVAPLAQELTYSDTLSLETHKKLDKLMTMLIGKRVEEIRIWRLDGTVLYSNEKEIVGKKLPLTNKFMAALSGSIGIEFGGDPHEGDESSQSYDGAILEIYAPIRNAHSGKIIAVAEFYLIEKELSKDLQRATALSWLFVGGVAFSMIAVLFGIVHSGSNMIERQKQDLAGQVGDLERLLGNNQELQQCLQCARRQTADINEKVLRRLGAELHDGPAQLVSMAILVLHSLANDEDETSQRSANFTRIESALTDSLREIRDLSAGLALPELTSANLENVVNLAVNAHKLRTKTEVICKVKTQAIQVPVFVKVCVYRFIQEALKQLLQTCKRCGSKCKRQNLRRVYRDQRLRSRAWILRRRAGGKSRGNCQAWPARTAGPDRDHRWQHEHQLQSIWMLLDGKDQHSQSATTGC